MKTKYGFWNNLAYVLRGMMDSSIKCGTLALQIVMAGILISGLHPLLIAILLGLLILSFLVVDKTKRKDKKLVWDALGPYWRKHFNMGYLTNHFTSAKEIRVYDMKDWIYRKYLGINEDIAKKIEGLENQEKTQVLKVLEEDGVDLPVANSRRSRWPERSTKTHLS